MNAKSNRGRKDYAAVSPWDRFQTMFTPVTESGCWLWTGRISHGYGVFSIKGKWWKAHRYSFFWHHGRPITPGMYVCHKCDTPSCVNPSHLYEGTAQENADDKVRRGRVACGEKLANSIKKRLVGRDCQSAKLTDDQIIEILSSNGTHREIARRFPVTEQAIGRIRNGKQWRHIT